MSRLGVGDSVFILPNSSLAFGGCWGKVSLVIGNSINVVLENAGELAFYPEELLSEETYRKVLMSRHTESVYDIELCKVLEKEALLESTKPNHFLVEGIDRHLSSFTPSGSCDVCGGRMKSKFSAKCNNCIYEEELIWQK